MSGIESNLYAVGQGVLTGSVPNAANLTQQAKSAFQRAAESISSPVKSFAKAQIQRGLDASGLVNINGLSGGITNALNGTSGVGYGSGYGNGFPSGGYGPGYAPVVATPAQQIARRDGGSWLNGGLSMADLQESVRSYLADHYHRKNYWYIEIEDANPPDGADNSSIINSYAVDLRYQKCALQGEAVAVGSVQFDAMSSSERAEISMTAFDDVYGSLEKWFAGKCSQVAASDGTFGVPGDYLLVMRIRRMAVGPEGWVHSSTPGMANKNIKWNDVFIVRPGTMDVEMSRREAALTELPMTFVQLDTHLSVR